MLSQQRMSVGYLCQWTCLLAIVLLLKSSSAIVSEKLFCDHPHRKLNILLVSDPPYGHLASLLALGEELVQRGHNVTQFLPLSEASQARYKAHVESFGVNLWNVSAEDLIHYDMEQMMKQVSKEFFSATITKLSQYGAVAMKVMAKHISKSLVAGEWDIILGLDYLESLLFCLSSAHDVPVLSVGKLISAFHLYPHWPWPNLMYGAHSDYMGFQDRMLSIPYSLAMKAFIYISSYPSLKALAGYCPSVDLTQLSGVRFPAIVPNVIGLEHPRTLSPMVHYVGPLIPRSAATLDKRLEIWLGGKAHRSVVYVSMGSLVTLDRITARALVEGVMETNFSILWSLRKSNQWILEGLHVDSDKVLISEWTPQLSVLGSSAIHSAILHGGFNGLSEALWNGVPIIVIPAMNEQIYNAGRVHFNALGIYLDIKDLNSSRIAESLMMLDTEEYQCKVSRIQKVFRVAGGVKRAADLVEHYEDIGYAHLIPAYAKYEWNWVQYYNVDVFAVVVFLLLLASVCLKQCCCGGICKRCCSSKTKQKTE